MHGFTKGNPMRCVPQYTDTYRTKTSYKDSKGLTNLKMSGNLVPDRTNIMHAQNSYNKKVKNKDDGLAYFNCVSKVNRNTLI